MHPTELLELLRARPFSPFRLHADDGRTYDVQYPDQALVLRSHVVLPLQTGTGFPERSENLDLIQIVRAEELGEGSSGNSIKADRRLLAHDVLDSLISETPTPLSEIKKQELDRRLEDCRANPDDVVPWEKIKAESIARRGR